ncbi:unnamed protein product [Amoebophrya sp. A120]|nr:unnamed protein product [Amoebophrya sp. A120]|eukprot:GSA120T00013520001.1
MPAVLSSSPDDTTAGGPENKSSSGSLASSNKRLELRQRQAAWMQQHQIALERKEHCVVAVRGATTEAGSNEVDIFRIINEENDDHRSCTSTAGTALSTSSSSSSCKNSGAAHHPSSSTNAGAATATGTTPGVLQAGPSIIPHKNGAPPAVVVPSHSQHINHTTQHQVEADVEMLSRLSKRIEASIRKELTENISKRQVAAELEKLIQDRLSTHQCPICMHLMTPARNVPGIRSSYNSNENNDQNVDRSPLLLFPCGHNLCTHCAKQMNLIPVVQHQHQSGTTTPDPMTQSRGLLNNSAAKKPPSKCPYCRAKVEHCALNRPLLEMITTFANSDEVVEKLEEDHENDHSMIYCSTTGTTTHGTRTSTASFSGGGPGSGQQRGSLDSGTTSNSSTTTGPNYYRQKYRHYTARVNVLEQELAEASEERQELEQKELQLSKSIEATKRETDQAFEQYQQLKMKLEALKLEQGNLLSKEKSENSRRLEVVRTALEPLKRDRDKCKIMLSHHFQADGTLDQEGVVGS